MWTWMRLNGVQMVHHASPAVQEGVQTAPLPPADTLRGPIHSSSFTLVCQKPDALIMPLKVKRSLRETIFTTRQIPPQRMEEVRDFGREAPEPCKMLMHGY